MYNYLIYDCSKNDFIIIWNYSFSEISENIVSLSLDQVHRSTPSTIHSGIILYSNYSITVYWIFSLIHETNKITADLKILIQLWIVYVHKLMTILVLKSFSYNMVNKITCIFDISEFGVGAPVPSTWSGVFSVFSSVTSLGRVASWSTDCCRDFLREAWREECLRWKEFDFVISSIWDVKL